MRNIYKTKYIAAILSIVFCFLSCNGQNKYSTEYDIGTIPNDIKFKKMIAREIRFDILKNEHATESLKRMLDGTAFMEGVSEADKKEAIEYYKITSQRYKDNRSRYYMELKINDKKDTELFKATDTLTSECSCYLKEDVIRVKMGVFTFGGFSFSIDLNKNKFKSTYTEVTHKQSIYKTELSNASLVDNILVKNEEQSLVLENKPSFLIGETILGYLTFKTKNYYRTNEYESNIARDNYSDEIMDKLNMTGSLYFKCKVRKKTHGDE